MTLSTTPASLPAVAAAVLCLLCSAGVAQAQAVYRVIGADGKVTFSDRAPSDHAKPTVGGSAGVSAEPSGAAALPYELRQVAARFPVVLYTGSDCAPCASARNLLISRGVPFTERTISSNEDIEALARLSGAASLPFGTIGAQQLSGFSDTEWTQYLDAASYPKQSQLPAAYRRPAATPLVAIKRAEPAATARADSSSAAPRPAPLAVPQGPTPANPAGIRF